MTSRMKAIIKPNSKETKIISDEGGTLTIAVRSPPEKGKANKELVRFLAKHFKRKVRIISGFRSKNKVLEIWLIHHPL